MVHVYQYFHIVVASGGAWPGKEEGPICYEVQREGQISVSSPLKMVKLRLSLRSFLA
jgi:hypothetical protein